MSAQRWLFTFICTLSMSSWGTESSGNEFIRTDRYTLVRLGVPEAQRQPLRTVITVTFGSSITSVGDAITELLNGSGYAWKSPEDAASDALLQQLPLPAIVRTIGPLRLSDALQVVAGESWSLQVDELHRFIWFTTESPHRGNHDVDSIPECCTSDHDRQ